MSAAAGRPEVVAGDRARRWQVLARGHAAEWEGRGDLAGGCAGPRGGQLRAAGRAGRGEP